MPDIRSVPLCTRRGMFLVLIVSPLLYGNGCSLFAKSALGKLGITIPSLVQENHDDWDMRVPDRGSENSNPNTSSEQIRTTARREASQQARFAKTHFAGTRFRAQAPESGSSAPTAAPVDWYGNPPMSSGIPAPPPLAAPESADRVDVLAPLEPLPEALQQEYARLNSVPTELDNPWLGPNHDSFPDQYGTENFGAIPEDGVSLHDVDAQVKAAEKEEKYRQTLRDVKTNKEKPWLDPLPHPYGMFAYRLESPTRGLGGESPEIVQAGFQPYEGKPKEQIEFYDWEKEEDQRFDWNSLDPVHVVKKIRNAMGMGPDEREATKLMQAGYELIRQSENFKNAGKTLEAADMFEKAGGKWPDSVLEEDALFLAGECYFFSDRYAPSAKKYEKLVTKYRSTKYMDTATMRLFKIGDYWKERYERGASFVNIRDKTRPHTDTFGNMRKAYEAVYVNDPSGPYGDRAILNLASAYMNLGQNPGDSYFSEAAELYALLPVVCPRSEYLAHAQRLELYARSLTYSGRQYDGKTLEDASVLAEKITRQYGDQLGAEREKIIEIRENISHQKAERLWEAGQYYETKKLAYTAARYNYEKLIADFPNSPRRLDAQNRLRAIADLEDVDSNLARLKAMFAPKRPAFFGIGNQAGNGNRRETDAPHHAASGAESPSLNR